MILEKKIHAKYLSLLLVILIFVITFLLLRPFLITIISAVLLTYIFYPAYRRLKKIFKSKNVSSFVTCLLIVLLFLVPLGLIVSSLAKDTISAYGEVSNFLSTTKIDLDAVSGYLHEKFGFQINLSSAITGVFDFFIEHLRNFLVTLPQKILNIFILFFLMYYLFKEGETLTERIKKFIPFKKIYKEKLIKEVGDVTHAVVYGYVITALAQATVGTLGLFIFGVKGALVWGLIMFFLSMLPYIGPPFVWVPASLILLINGITSHSPNLIGRGIGLFIYGILIISSIDNIIRPKVIGSRANVSPAIILLGVVGGMTLFGVIGIILGPLILSIFFTTLKIYEEEK
ncbi:MAG: AI-2E family transporter [Patescibacteria group bacterium]